MGLLDDVRHGVENAANTAVEVGQNLGAQAQVQLNIKKLQLDRARKQHDLGARSYEAHQAALLAPGPTAAMLALFHEMDSLNLQIVEQERRLHEIKAEAAAQRSAATPPVGVSGTPSATPPPATPQA